MTSATFQGALFVSLIALSAGLKTESIVEMRNDIMMEHTSAMPASQANLESKASPKSLSSKVKENFDALEVAIAVQMATQQRLAGFVQGSLFLVVLAVLGLYAINNQSGKNGKKACTVDADVKTSPAPVPAQVPLPSATEIEQEEDLDMYFDRQQADEDCDDSALYKMLDDSLEAEAEAACVVHSVKEEASGPTRAELETRELIEQELDRYLDRQHANKELDADLSVLNWELNKMLDLNNMLDCSLETEAEAAMVIHNVEEEVDVSRIEMEIAEQMSEALGFSQVPVWME